MLVFFLLPMVHFFVCLKIFLFVVENWMFESCNVVTEIWKSDFPGVSCFFFFFPSISARCLCAGIQPKILDLFEPALFYRHVQ